ncbi:MAG: 50S ribosomal protein L32 [Chloroflexi bacterium]|nr:50S ribosomal protein L32 [Chloroflexota bacterium]
MGALPKKKRTRARIGPRKIGYRLWTPALSPCPQCHNPRRSHRICPTCGYYRGREVISKDQAAEPA